MPCKTSPGHQESVPSLFWNETARGGSGARKCHSCECHAGTSVPWQPGKRTSAARCPCAWLPASAAAVPVRARLHGHRGVHTHTHTHMHLPAAARLLLPRGSHMSTRTTPSSARAVRAHPPGFPAKAHGAHVSHSAALPGPSGRCWPRAPLQGAVTSRWELMGSSFPDVLGHVCSARMCRSPSWTGGEGGSPVPGTARQVGGQLGQLWGGSSLPASVSPPVNQPNFAR